MPAWLRNLEAALQTEEVCIVHGNVRDRYITDSGTVYDGLTPLLEALLGIPGDSRAEARFEQVIYYDVGAGERVRTFRNAARTGDVNGRRSGADDLTGIAPRPETARKKAEPQVVVAGWRTELANRQRDTLVIVQYLDKLIGYRSQYAEQEAQLLVWLEKAIENITPNNRMVLVALRDSMVPVELYLHAPKVRVLPIPQPDQTDRLRYLRQRVAQAGGQVGETQLKLISDLTDGLYLRDLDHIVTGGRLTPRMSDEDVRALVNRFRLGEQEDRWATLSIERLADAYRWFRAEGGIREQDHAIEKMVDMLCVARTQLSGLASGTESKPRGILFFAGPTGVGKTLCARALARFLFSDEGAYIRFDMSELQEEHSVAKLIGSPPGYVGYEEGGHLTNAVRGRPYCVILFDELEKAHPRILDILLQVLDAGRLTDSRGQTVFFTESVIIFTSNIGTRTTDSRGRPISERAEVDAILAQDLPAAEAQRLIQQHFVRCVDSFFTTELSRPELLNRIGGNVVPFNYIQLPEAQAQIVEVRLAAMAAAFQDKYKRLGYRLEWEPGLAGHVVTQFGGDMAKFGGRGIGNALHQHIVVPLAKQCLEAEHAGRQGVVFRVGVRPQLGIAIESGLAPTQPSLVPV